MEPMWMTSHAHQPAQGAGREQPAADDHYLGPGLPGHPPPWLSVIRFRLNPKLRDHEAMNLLYDLGECTDS